jgi:TMEM175 potassium channel family protein
MYGSDIETSHRQAPLRGLHLNRVESLTDGVFAIAMTILVFDLKGAPLGARDTNGLLAFLASITDNLISYVISFFLLGLFWFYYHKQLHRIARADDGLVWLNLGFLFVVTLVPFTAYVYGKYFGAPLASLIYCGNFVLVGLFQLLHWLHAMRKGLLDPRVTEEIRVGTTLRAAIVLGCYSLAFAIALVNPYAFMVAFWVIPFALMASNRWLRKRYAAVT